uniref:Uncharacterized protein n=1 Tax=Poecilia latipinna TaxID=48699 RepID=A0A3B3VG99_9TELE
MDDELENFIRERKARVAEDKASLEKDPPYMEMRAKPCRNYGSTVKENIPPRINIQVKGIFFFVGLPLGAEYEKKKHRLQHELRMDYRRYMAQVTASLSHSHTDHVSGKKKKQDLVNRFTLMLLKVGITCLVQYYYYFSSGFKSLRVSVESFLINLFSGPLQPDRIRQLGLSRREVPGVTEPSATAESGSSSRTTASAEGAVVRGRDMPPPGLPHVAFQSPLLEYSSALGLGEGHLSPSSQHSSLSTNARETHRYNGNFFGLLHNKSLVFNNVSCYDALTHCLSGFFQKRLPSSAALLTKGSLQNPIRRTPSVLRKQEPA